MNGKGKLVGYTLATTAALSFALLPVNAAYAGDSDTIQCYGVNACKGQTECKSIQNECKGKNSCKGVGLMGMSTDECTKSGGAVTPT